MAREYGKKTFIGNVIKGGKSQAGKEYGDFVSITAGQDFVLKKGMTLNLVQPKDRVAQLEKDLAYAEANGKPTDKIEELLLSAKDTMEKGKVRFIITHQDIKET
jgi:hypothetical protein